MPKSTQNDTLRALALYVGVAIFLLVGIAASTARCQTRAAYCLKNKPNAVLLSHLTDDHRYVFLHPRAVFNDGVDPMVIGARERILYMPFMDWPYQPNSANPWTWAVSDWIQARDGYALTINNEMALRWDDPSLARYHIDPQILDPIEFAEYIYSWYEASEYRHILLDLYETNPWTPPGKDRPAYLASPTGLRDLAIFQLSLVARLRQLMGPAISGRLLILNGPGAEQNPSMVSANTAQGVLWENFGGYYGGAYSASERLGAHLVNMTWRATHFLHDPVMPFGDYMARVSQGVIVDEMSFLSP